MKWKCAMIGFGILCKSKCVCEVSMYVYGIVLYNQTCIAFCEIETCNKGFPFFHLIHYFPQWIHFEISLTLLPKYYYSISIIASYKIYDNMICTINKLCTDKRSTEEEKIIPFLRYWIQRKLDIHWIYVFFGLYSRHCYMPILVRCME